MKKKILLRASVPPYEKHTPSEVINKKIIGDNSGNLLFAYSVTRLLWREDVDIDFIADKDVIANKISTEYINANYSCLVLPMANSFRKQFVECMNKWTKLINKLIIPVVVTGIGIQMPYEPDIAAKHPYDNAVKDFISAVLNHSSSVGVRGEITLKYLQHLGFRDIDVTGCPSFAMFGPGLPVREKKPLTKESAICVTGSVSNPVNFKEFVIRNREILPNYYFVPQFVNDLKLMYMGTPLPLTKNSLVLYPHRIDDEVFVEDRARFFINVPSILAFGREMDFNYGTRIHGAVGNILSGVPSYLFPTDARIRELAEYHNIPNMSAFDVDEKTNLIKLYDKTDFSQVNDGHEQRFWHLIDFLEHNYLSHIYEDRSNPENAVSVLDKKIEETELEPPVHSMLSCSVQEIAKRMSLSFEEMENKSATNENQIDSLSSEINDVIKRLEKTEKQLSKKTQQLDRYMNSSTFEIGKARLKKKMKSKKQ